MVGRLPESRWNYRQTPAIGDSRECFRDDPSPSIQSCRRNASPIEPGTVASAFDPHVRGVRGTAFCSVSLPDTESLNSKALSPNLPHSPITSVSKTSSLRYDHVRHPALCAGKDGKRLGLGERTALPQPHLESLHRRKEMGLLFWRQSRKWGDTPGETACTGKAHPATGADFRVARCAERTRSDHGRLRIGEILGLSWTSLDSTSGQLRVEQALYRGTLGTPKTKRSRRTVPLPQSLVVALTRLKAQRRTANSEDDLVFLTRNGTPYSDTNLLRQHLKPAGRYLEYLG